jgi:ArsR family metal-binding transcriptional regulator
MIDLYNLMPAANVCECGNPECDYDTSLPIAEDQQAIAEALVLESPILKLIKERNEARELVKRMLRATDGVTDSKEYYAAMLAAHRAEMTWKGGAQ